MSLPHAAEPDVDVLGDDAAAPVPPLSVQAWWLLAAYVGLCAFILVAVGALS